MVDYKKIFEKAQKGGDEDLQKMVEQGTQRYAALGINIEEESGLQQFVSDLMGVSQERAVVIYEAVQFILGAKHKDFSKFEDFAKAAQERINVLTPGEAMMAGMVISLQMRTQTEMLKQMKNSAVPEEQPVQKKTVMEKPLCTQQEEVALDEDGEVEEPELPYKADYSYTVGYQ
jgi:hypothetical protein